MSCIASALAMRLGEPGRLVSPTSMSDSSVRPPLVTSGIADYPRPRFILWEVLGQVLGVVLYVMLGYVFAIAFKPLLRY